VLVLRVVGRDIFCRFPALSIDVWGRKWVLERKAFETVRVWPGSFIARCGRARLDP
jgi:hypothetical protein